MTLFNPVFNCLTPIVIKRSKTQTEEGLTPANEAGSVVLRQPPASKLANLFRIDVRDHALGLVTQQLGGRSREHPAGWVAVEATSRPRQFGYETPQLWLERRLHAGSPYRSNDLVGAGPEPPLSCDLRLNHAKPGATDPAPHVSNSCAEILESVFRQLQLCVMLRSDERFICG